MLIGLINNAIIDWFLPWPEQALFAVATSLLAEDVSILIDKGNERRFRLVVIKIFFLFFFLNTFIYIVY